MIGLYFLGVVMLWILLTWLLLRFGWRSLAREKSRARSVLVVAIVLGWLGASFWYGGGRKIYYDWKVDRLCEIDGGVKVYETVELPVDRFDEYGNVGIKNKRYVEPSDKYYFESDTVSLREGNPKIIRSTTRIIRRSDGMILGESIRYGRGGGDLPGPWHPSSYDCPQIKNAEGKLESSIFVKGEK